MTNLYESGGVAPPLYSQEWSVCDVCGNTWFGNQRFLCPACIALDQQDRSAEEGGRNANQQSTEG